MASKNLKRESFYSYRDDKEGQRVLKEIEESAWDMGLGRGRLIMFLLKKAWDNTSIVVELGDTEPARVW